MVIRKVARPMVASVYVADGADMVLNTQAHVEGAEAVLRHVRSIVSRSTYQKLPQDPESRAESESMVSQAADWLGDASGRVVQYVGDNREDWLEAAQANSRVAGKRVVRAAVAAQEQAQAAYADAQVLSGRAARRAVRQADRLQVRAVRALRRAQERLDGKV